MYSSDSSRFHLLLSAIVSVLLLGCTTNNSDTSARNEEYGPALLVVRGNSEDAIRSRLKSAIGKAHADRILLSSATIRARSGAVQFALSRSDAAFQEEIATALRSFESRVNGQKVAIPLDLEPGKPGDELLKVAGRFMPSLVATRAILADRWISADRKTVIVPRRSRPPASVDQMECLHPWSKSAAAIDKEVRFLAWPVMASAVLEFKDRISADNAAAALKKSATLEESRIALVITADVSKARVATDIGPAATRVEEQITANKIKAEKRLGSILKELADSSSAAPMPPWLQLKPGQVMVVPRMSALAFLDQFTREIQRTLAEQTPEPEWIFSPHAAN